MIPLIIILSITYIFGAIVALNVSCEEYSNHRVVKGGGIFGGNTVECTTTKRRPTEKDVMKAFIWPFRLAFWFICTTLWLFCDWLFLSDSKFAKWLDRHS